MSRLRNPPHIGEILEELYLKPLDMTSGSLARHLGVPQSRIERLLKGEIEQAEDMAMRLSRFFNTTPGYWMNLQGVRRDIAHACKTVDVSAITPLKMPLDQPSDDGVVIG